MGGGGGVVTRLAWARIIVYKEKIPIFFPPSPPPIVLHDNKLTHTDLKPENILFVNSDFTMTYNVEKVSALVDEVRGPTLPICL